MPLTPETFILFDMGSESLIESIIESRVEATLYAVDQARQRQALVRGVAAGTPASTIIIAQRSRA